MLTGLALASHSTSRGTGHLHASPPPRLSSRARRPSPTFSLCTCLVAARPSGLQPAVRIRDPEIERVRRPLTRPPAEVPARQSGCDTVERARWHALLALRERRRRAATRARLSLPVSLSRRSQHSVGERCRLVDSTSVLTDIDCTRHAFTRPRLAAPSPSSPIVPSLPLLSPTPAAWGALRFLCTLRLLSRWRACLP